MVPLNHKMGQDLVVLLLELGGHCKFILSDALRIVICVLDRARLIIELIALSNFFRTVKTTNILNCIQIKTKWEFYVAL